MNRHRNFYENIDRDELYAPFKDCENHPAYQDIKQFVARFDLSDKKCLEIGSYRGIFQNMVGDYTGLDVALSLSKYYKKPYFTINGDGTYPFADKTFDAVWSWAVHEHIPDLN
jgi:hypothetical protein